MESHFNQKKNLPALLRPGPKRRGICFGCQEGTVLLSKFLKNLVVLVKLLPPLNIHVIQTDFLSLHYVSTEVSQVEIRTKISSNQFSSSILVTSMNSFK